MAKKVKTALEKKISSEVTRLKKNFDAIDAKKKSIIEGLIERASFMRISLDDLEDDLNQNGFTEWFSQGDQEPYQRKRPAADLYNTMNANYQKIIKQLTDLTPKEEPKDQQGGDSFDTF